MLTRNLEVGTGGSKQTAPTGRAPTKPGLRCVVRDRTRRPLLFPCLIPKRSGVSGSSLHLRFWVVFPFASYLHEVHRHQLWSQTDQALGPWAKDFVFLNRRVAVFTIKIIIAPSEGTVKC